MATFLPFASGFLSVIKQKGKSFFLFIFLFHTHIYTQTHPALKCSVLYSFTCLMLHIRKIMTRLNSAVLALQKSSKICRNYSFQMSILHHKISLYNILFSVPSPYWLKSKSVYHHEFSHTERWKQTYHSLKAGLCMSVVLCVCVCMSLCVCVSRDVTTQSQ